MRQLLNFVALNYIDKLLGFIAVFLVAQLGSQIEQYNRLEYIYGVGVVLSVFLDLGIYKYLYYGHKNSEDPQAYLQKMQFGFCQLLILYLTLCVLLISFFYEHGNAQTASFILIRISYLLALPFFIACCRLSGSRLILVLGISASCNLVSLIYAGISSVQASFSISIFVLPQLAFCIASIVILVGKDLKSAAWLIIILRTDYRSIFKYSAPVMGGVFLTSLFNNYAKLTSYNTLSDSDTFDIMLSQRLSMLLLLTHGGLVSYLSKNIFDRSENSDSKTIAMYFGVIFAVASLLVVVFYAASETVRIFPLKISDYLIFYMFICGSLMWCGGAFLEIFINREGKTHLTFLSVVLASLLTIAISHWYSENTALSLSLVPLTFSAFYIILNTLLLVRVRNELVKT